MAENYQGEIENEQLIHNGRGGALGAKGGSCS